jgi:hypothetical protein
MIKISLSGQADDVQRAEQLIRQAFRVLNRLDPPPQPEAAVRREFEAAFSSEAELSWRCPLCRELILEVDQVAHLMLEHRATQEPQQVALLLAQREDAAHVAHLTDLVRDLSRFNQQENRSEALHRGVRSLVRHAAKGPR